MKYQLPPLAYEYNALEPHIDTRTMEVHYTKHHAGYVNNLNKALESCPDLANKTLEEILLDIRMVPEEFRQAVRNNGGGHLNHSLFWHVMGPPRGAQPSGTLREAIDSTFGDLAGFKDKLSRAAESRFGSGWGWLCVDSRGRLEVLSTPNQDSPIMQGCRPVVGVDVWEHAYYLKYENRRAEYIAAWWNVVDWDKAAEIYAHCMESVGRTK